MATSTCPRCFAGTCKEHSKAALGSAAAEKADLMQRMYDNLVGKQLEKLKKAKDAAKLDADMAQYRDSLARSRDKKREKKSSKGSSSSVAALHSGSGLNPQALAAICSSDEDATPDKRSSKRDKKRKKESKKDSKKSKKAKKASKSSKKRRPSSDSSSDGSSDSDSSDSGRGARPSKKRHRHD